MASRGTVFSDSGNLVHRSAPDFIYTSMFAMLSLIHASIAVPAFARGRWEGCLSMFLSVLFGTAAVLCRRFRYEVAVLADDKQVRLRHGVGRFCFERRVAFLSFDNVRLTILGDQNASECQIELLSQMEVISYPAAEHPRQEALLLAMTMNVPLIKVYGETALPAEEPVHVRQA